jgi:perosamine synthetase
MTNLQAAIGLAQLERIEDIHKNRREYEKSYKNFLPANKFTFQNDLENRRRITWLVSVLLDDSINREEYIHNLKERGIDARPFFYPLSDMKIYKKYSNNETPVTHKLSRIGLNLPTYESLISIEDIKTILKDLSNV